MKPSCVVAMKIQFNYTLFILTVKFFSGKVIDLKWAKILIPIISVYMYVLGLNYKIVSS